MPFSRHPFVLENLAAAFLGGPWTRRTLLRRGQNALPGRGRELRGAIRRMLAVFAEHAPPSFDVLLSYLVEAEGRFESASIGQYYWHQQTMMPRGEVAQSWQVPALTTTWQLAKWLNITTRELEWLADVHGWTSTSSGAKLRHYVYRWQPRRRGRFRLIESPKAKLKRIQSKVLREILDRIPPHPAAHGFRAGHSIVTFAKPHVGQRIVLRFDLRDFFPSVRVSQVHGLFRTAGYPLKVARLLTGLCTSRIPLEIWEQRPEPRATDAELGERLRSAHLPQGTPTSPGLANLCAQRLDRRLAGLARAARANYTRYADDLAFSGGEELARSARRFQIAVAVIAAEEGFALHFRKSRFMHQGVRQQLAGIVVNHRPNVRRQVYDNLKATLTNCIRHGPATQNRHNIGDFRAHLLGQIAHVNMVHSERGAKLGRLFERISW